MDFSQLSGSMLIGALIGLVIGILIGALILSVVNRLVNGFWANYGRCLGTVIVVGIIVGIINYVLGLVIGAQSFWLLLVTGLVLQTLIGGAIMNAFVRRPDGSPLGFKRAALVFLILAIINLLFSVGMQHWAASMQAGLTPPPAG